VRNKISALETFLSHASEIKSPGKEIPLPPGDPCMERLYSIAPALPVYTPKNREKMICEF